MSLNNLLDRIEEVEKNTDSLYQLVKFKATEGLFAEIYKNNPFKNEPKVGEFYAKLFNDKILPKLFRRFEYCPTHCTLLTKNLQNCTFSNILVPDDVIFEWNYLIGQCLACDSNKLLCLSPNSQPTQIVENGKDVTSDRFLIPRHPDSIFDVEKHKYGKISIEGKKYTKYSADVFKMGRGTLDNRCSRIFYCKVKDKIHFYEFDPDFHKGE